MKIGKKNKFHRENDVLGSQEPCIQKNTIFEVDKETIPVLGQQAFAKQSLQVKTLRNCSVTGCPIYI